jgi:hypothetical protein
MTHHAETWARPPCAGSRRPVSYASPKTLLLDSRSRHRRPPIAAAICRKCDELRFRKKQHDRACNRCEQRSRAARLLYFCLSAAIAWSPLRPNRFGFIGLRRHAAHGAVHTNDPQGNPIQL